MRRIVYIFLLLFLFNYNYQIQAQTDFVDLQNRKIDSLLSLLDSSSLPKINLSDTSRVKILISVSDIYTYQLFNYSLALNYALKANSSATKSGDKSLMSGTLRKTGNIYYLQWKYDKAVEYYLAGLKAAEEKADKKNMASCLNNLGNVHTHMAENSNSKANYDKALDYHLRALELRKNDNESICHSLLNISNVYRGLKQHEKAINYIEKANSYYVERKDSNGIDLTQTSLGEVYLDWARQTKKTEHFNAAEKHFQERLSQNKATTRTPAVLIFLGEIRYLQNRNDEAIRYFERGMQFVKNLNDIETQKKGALLLSHALKKNNDFKAALGYHKLYRLFKDSLLSQKSNNQITELNTRYETEKKENDIHLLTKNKVFQQTEISKQKLMLNAFIIGLIIVTMATIILYSRYTIKQKLNVKLDTSNKLLQQTNTLIETQKENIISSINYAKLMQQIIVLDEQEIEKHLPHSFVYYQPKDIVSGDFYWCAKVNEKIIIAVVDCTGHGVPGAFMSIIGNTLLNQIVKQRMVTSPAEILSLLNIGVYKVLHQNKESLSDDGMDISLCCIDYKNKTLEYAGAQQPLYLFSDNRLKVIKGDIYTIGGGNFPVKKGNPLNIKYTNHTFPLISDTTLYLFTDGYTDQFGGPERKKLGSTAFQALISDIQHLDVKEQGEHIAKTNQNWKGDIQQTDDILVLGIHIPLA